MKLVIRSQNKEILKKYNDIIEIRFIRNNIGYDDGWAIFIDKAIMGVYSTKDRALEVLNEIKKILDDYSDRKILKNITDISKQLYIVPVQVYEMPRK